VMAVTGEIRFRLYDHCQLYQIGETKGGGIWLRLTVKTGLERIRHFLSLMIARFPAP